MKYVTRLTLIRGILFCSSYASTARDFDFQSNGPLPRPRRKRSIFNSRPCPRKTTRRKWIFARGSPSVIHVAQPRVSPEGKSTCRLWTCRRLRAVSACFFVPGTREKATHNDTVMRLAERNESVRALRELHSGPLMRFYNALLSLRWPAVVIAVSCTRQTMQFSVLSAISWVINFGWLFLQNYKMLGNRLLNFLF